MTYKRKPKAERIFDQNFYGAVNHMKIWGEDEPFDAWNTLCNRNNEYICRRTVNEVLAFCDRMEKRFDWRLKHGYESEDYQKIYRKALRIVRNTCNNWIDAYTK